MMLWDSLTGPPEPYHDERTTHLEPSQMRRGKMSLAIALINLDNFKSVNDTDRRPSLENHVQFAESALADDRSYRPIRG